MTAHDATGPWARALVRTQWEDVLRHKTGTLQDSDPEDLHQMRVSLRRLRTAIAAFADSLPLELVALDSELRWIGEHLGSVRDLDVQLESLTQFASRDIAPVSAMESIAGGLLKQRAEARERMVACLTSSRFEEIARGVYRALDNRDEGSSASMQKQVPRVLRASYRAFRVEARSLEPKSKPARLHRARKRLRRLRFTVEFLDEFSGDGGKRLSAACVQLQDVLGAHQDCYASIATRGSLRSVLPKNVRPVLDAMDSKEIKRARKLRRKVPAAVKRVRKRWKPLKHTLR